ncbi:MAG: hypothetical protein KME10_19660 [Plectolyngbya sp. WJT66-NPBG17]|jgi:phage-related protein|nr:hypothetical protein [Plectolyngbya sp. WJT66-NPBG17]
MSLAILDKLQSTELDPGAIFAEPSSILKQSKNSASQLNPSTSILGDESTAITSQIDQAISSLSNTQSSAAVLQAPFSTVELHHQLGGQMGGIAALTPETLTQAISKNPGADSFKSGAGDVNDSVSDLVTELTKGKDGKPLIPALSVTSESSPFAEFQQFLVNAGALPSKVLDTIVKVFRKFLDKLSNPQDWIQDLSSNALTDLFIAQVKALSNQLPDQAIQQIGIRVHQQSKLINSYTQFLTTTDFDPEKLDRTTLKELRQTVTGWTVEVQVSAQAIEQALATLTAFDAKTFETTLKSFSQVSVSDPEGGLAKLFKGIQDFVDRLKANILAVTKKLGDFIGKIGKLISDAIKKVSEIATKIVKTISAKIDDARKVLEKVQVYLKEAIDKLKKFVEEACQQSSEKIVKPLKETCNSLITTVDGGISKIGNNIKQATDKINGSLGQFKQTLETNLNREQLQKKIEELLGKILSFLQSKEIQSAIDTAKGGIDKAVKALEQVSLEPAFKSVVAKTTSLEGKLKEIKVAELSTPKKVALQVGTGIIKQVNVPGIVNPELKETFASIVDPLEKMVGSVNTEFNQISDRVEQFEPGKLVENWLSPHIVDLVTELKRYQPSKLLADVENYYHSLIDKLNVLDPDQLIQLLNTLYDKLFSVVSALNPENLIQFLRQQKRTIVRVLDNLSTTGIDSVVQAVSSALGSAEKLLGGLGLDILMQGDFWTTLREILSLSLQQQINQVNTFQAKCVSYINAITPEQDDKILAELTALNQAIIDYTKNPADRVRSVYDASVSELTLHKTAKTQLNTQWTETSSMLESFSQRIKNAVEPFRYEFEYEDLRQRLEALKKAMSDALVSMNIESSLEVVSRSPNSEKLANLKKADYPKILSAFKSEIPNAIEQQLTAPIRKILTSLDEILAEPKKLLTKIEIVFKALQDAPTQIKEILDGAATALATILRSAIASLKDLVVCFGIDEADIESERNLYKNSGAASTSASDSRSFKFIADIYKEIETTLRSLRPVIILNSFSGASDFKNAPQALIDRLKDSSNPVSAYIWAKLDEAQQTRLNAPGEGAVTVLVKAFNALLTDAQFYLESRFEVYKDKFTTVTKELIQKRDRLKEEELVRLNRLLLEAVYGSEITLSLQSVFPKLIRMLHDLYPKETIQKLDEFHATIITNLEEIPQAIGKALYTTYQKLIKVHRENIKEPIQKAFRALQAKLYALQGQLYIGLDDVGDAFNHLLSVIPV